MDLRPRLRSPILMVGCFAVLNVVMYWTLKKFWIGGSSFLPMIGQFGDGTRGGPGNRLRRDACELLGKTRDVHILLPGRLQMVQGQLEFFVVLPAKADADGRDLHGPTGNGFGFGFRCNGSPRG